MKERMLADVGYKWIQVADKTDSSVSGSAAWQIPAENGLDAPLTTQQIT